MLDAPELQPATFEVRPSDTMVGAEVLGLDLSKPLDEAAFEKVSAALDSFPVVCFRNQVLTPEQHIAFSRRFGPLQVNVRSEFNKPGYPEIYMPIPVHRGQSFRRIADSVPVIADSC
jgi:taurine dioxygenase